MVKLGFEADNAQYARVQQVLDRLSFTVQQHMSGITKTFVGMGLAVTGVYAAIGTATLTMMEKVARADLGYQLYAQRMYLSVGAARQLKSEALWPMPEPWTLLRQLRDERKNDHGIRYRPMPVKRVPPPPDPFKIELEAQLRKVLRAQRRRELRLLKRAQGSLAAETPSLV